MTDKQSIAKAIKEGKIFVEPLTKKAEIMRLFNYNPSEVYSAFIISDQLGIKQDLVQLYLHKLLKSGYIRRMYHGHYALNIAKETTSKSPQELAKDVPGINPPEKVSGKGSTKVN